MASLFDSCLQVVLADSRLAEGAALYLPSKISHYILYEAVYNSNQEKIEKMVAGWSHETLSFDFFSNPLFRKRKEYSTTCIEASKFYNIFSSVDLPERVYHSILVGLFINVHSHLARGVEPSLKHVNMVNISTDSRKVVILSSLIRGEYPTMPNDNSNIENTSSTIPKVARPTTLLNIKSARVPITIHINISFHAKLSTEVLTLLSVPSSKTHFKVAVSGVNITSNTLTSQEVNRILETLRLEPSTLLKVIHINPALIDDSVHIHLPSLQPQGSLWLYIPQGTEESQHCIDACTSILGNTKSLKDLIVVCTDSSTVQTTLTAVSNKCKINSLSLLKDTTINVPSATTVTVNMTEIMRTSLPCFADGLEYLQLHQTTLADLPLSTLQNCSKLRVLSISETDSSQFFKLPNTPSDCFNAIANLNCLQYFEWAANCNLRTVDVLALYQLLSDSLPLLQHCHLYLLYMLLFTTDLDKVEYKPIMSVLHCLLKGLAGDDSCSTYRFSFMGRKFVHWLHTVRPSACIKCDSILKYRPLV